MKHAQLFVKAHETKFFAHALQFVEVVFGNRHSFRFILNSIKERVHVISPPLALERDRTGCRDILVVEDRFLKAVLLAPYNTSIATDHPDRH